MGTSSTAPPDPELRREPSIPAGSKVICYGKESPSGGLSWARRREISQVTSALEALLQYPLWSVFLVCF